jgi:hypothetical protein
MSKKYKPIGHVTAEMLDLMRYLHRTGMEYRKNGNRPMASKFFNWSGQAKFLSTVFDIWASTPEITPAQYRKSMRDCRELKKIMDRVWENNLKKPRSKKTSN